MTLRALALAIALLLAPPMAVAQQEVRATEVGIKAAFLYKFCAFVEWPAGVLPAPDAPFTIGVLGADAVAEELTRVVARRTVNGRAVQVRKLQRGAPLGALQVLFIGGQDASRLAEQLASARGRPMLVVTETRDGPAQGSMINFVLVDDKVRFDVALPSAEAGKLKISSRLLAVARKVLGAPS